MGKAKEIAWTVRNIAPWDSVTNPEGRLLYKLAKRCKNGCIVEIGSWKGRSTIWLAKGSLAGCNPTVYAIDPHTGTATHEQYNRKETLDEFHLNMKEAEVTNIVKPLVMTSEKASKGWDKSVGFAFIDGSHDYKSVLFDFTTWACCMANGGVAALHDTVGYDGPHKVAINHLFKSRKFAHIGVCHKITYARKVPRCGNLTMLWKLLLLQVWRIYAHLYFMVAKVKMGTGKK